MLGLYIPVHTCTPMPPWPLRSTTTLVWSLSALSWAGLPDYNVCPLIRVLQRQPVALSIKSKMCGAFLSETRQCVLMRAWCTRCSGNSGPCSTAASCSCLHPPPAQAQAQALLLFPWAAASCCSFQKASAVLTSLSLYMPPSFVYDSHPLALW